MNKGFNIETLVRKNVSSLKPYSSARDEFTGETSDMVFLDANENPFETNVNRYPDPQQRTLKQEIASQKEISPSQMLLGNGSDEVLDLIFRAFCEPKQDNIITMPPTYGMYRVLAGINDVENREIILQDNFEPNVEAVLDAQDENSKLLFICSPNNPTGNAFSEDAILELIQGFKGLVVVDEAYIDFSEKPSWVNRLSEFPNLIVTQTLSKAYGMAGIRLGICFASAEIISVLNKIKPPYNVNELTQQSALTRLTKGEEVKNEVESILEEKIKLKEVILELPFVSEVFPSDANFLLVRVDDAGKRYDQLIQKGIVVRNRSSQPLCEQTLRFTVGTPDENRLLIKTLKELSK